MEVDGGYASAILAPKGEEGPVGGHLEVMATRVIRPEGFRFNVRGGPEDTNTPQHHYKSSQGTYISGVDDVAQLATPEAPRESSALDALDKTVDHRHRSSSSRAAVMHDGSLLGTRALSGLETYCGGRHTRI